MSHTYNANTSSRFSVLLEQVNVVQHAYNMHLTQTALLKPTIQIIIQNETHAKL